MQEGAKAEGKPSNTARVRTASGTEIDTRYRVVSAGTLIASHGENGGPNEAYPKELQPRDRSREASVQQIHQMAASLDPELLGENRMASDGAPIVGPDSVVESGNGRVMAIRRAYRTGKADGYRTWLMENAEKFGLTKEDVEAVADPVLIRERTSDVDRVRFVQEANQSSVSRMSKTEQALADAQRITPEMLVDLDPDADIASAANRKFVQQFLEKVVGDTEKGAFIDARGDLSQEGKERISNALFAYAYGDTEAMARLRETLDDDTKTINTALLGISPRIADMESKMRQGGLRKDLSIREPLMEAINMMAQLKRNGERVSDYLDQGMIFSAGNISPEARAILQFLEENKRSAKKISEGLARYADLVDERGSPDQGRIFEAEPMSREELIKIAFGHEVGEHHATAEERALERPLEVGVRSWLDAKKMYRDMFMKGGMDTKQAEAAGALAATFAQWRAEVTGQSIDDAVKAIGLDVEKATSVPSTGDADLDLLLQAMFHGTRHKLKGHKFKLEYIGTGEGTQAFGYGAYLAQVRGVSEGYRKAGVNKVGTYTNASVVFSTSDGNTIRFDEQDQKWKIGGVPIEDPSLDRIVTGWANGELGRVRYGWRGSLQADVADALTIEKEWLNTFKREQAQEKERLEKARAEGDAWRIEVVGENLRSADDRVAKQEKLIADLEAIAPVSVTVENAGPGNLYIVEGPEDDVLLDWDAPLSDQPLVVKKAIAEAKARFDMTGIGKKYPKTGMGFYWALGDAIGPEWNISEGRKNEECDKAASLWLKDHGVVGNRHWDRSSRKKGEGTHNFVIWDVDTLEVMDVEGPAKEEFDAWKRGEERYEQAQVAKGDGMYNGFRLPFDPKDIKTESGRSIEEAASSEMLVAPD
ncbi:MAG: hypothetical protein IJR14_03950, partial [Synergistaceae bacterium]|nr:hypothetical protein [Synergistaceae bacterium]